MLKQAEKTIMLTPFVVAYEQPDLSQARAAAPKPKKAGAHLGKEEATREVLNRIVQRVKKI